MRSHPLALVFSFLIAFILGLSSPGTALPQPKPKGPGQPPPPPRPPGQGTGGPGPQATLAQLGKQIFFDRSLSNPAGTACASCHAPATGFTFPSSNTNAQIGTAPGAAPGRFGNRKPSTISYASFSPKGPTFNPALKVYFGGQFWDGRAPDLVAQVPGPLFNVNEMNNVLHNLPAPELVVQNIAKGGYATLFKQVFGANVFALPPAQVIPLVAQAVATWETTAEVSSFSSKYDMARNGQAQLNASELNGLRLVTGSTTGRPGGPPFKNAQCGICHGIPADPRTGPDLWTFFGFANIGVPRNPRNPFYIQTNAATNPLGFNAQGANFVDYGLGGVLYPAQQLPAGNTGVGSNGLGDFLAINGLFKTPTLRNVDKRPSPAFVKAYFHNGGFKSLEQVVRFYNTRNLTSKAGEVIDFTLANPYAGLVGQPIWPPPEVLPALTLQNPTGQAGKIGNLGLTLQEEADIVAFLRTLTDQR